MLSQALEASKEAIVILDGLDECDDPSQRSLCGALTSFGASSAAKMQVLVTCREEAKALRYLSNFLHLRVTPEASRADLDSYVAEEIRSRIQFHDIVLQNAQLESEIVERLALQAQGM